MFLRRVKLLVAVRWCLACVCLTSAGAIRAQGSVYVPILDPAYDDLGVLIAHGLVTTVMVGDRPYSRAAFTRFVRQADSLAGASTSTPRIREALERLQSRFRKDSDSSKSVRLAPFSATLSMARSPSRAMQSGYEPDVIDADLNPLLQRNAGRVLFDGLTLAVEGGGAFERGRFAAELTARGHGGLDRIEKGAGDVHLLTGYVRAVAGPLAIDVGRTPMLQGFGVHGGAMLSDNARPLDLIRVRAERPVRLPGILRHAGAWQGVLSAGTLGRNRDQPGSGILVARLSNQPSRFVEFGLNYMNVQGGEGAPAGTAGERWYDLFLFWKNGGFYNLSDKAVGADVRVSVPSAQLALYANFLTTDDRGRFRQPAGGYWEDAIWVVGAERHGLGTEGRLDLRVEARHTGPVPHTHYQFTSGITLDRRVLGDALGPNSSGLLFEGTWTATQSRLRISVALEDYTSDYYALRRIAGGGFWDFDWFRIRNGPEERRQRVTADYLQFRGWQGLEVGVRGGYERVGGFDFKPGARHNVLALLTVRGLR